MKDKMLKPTLQQSLCMAYLAYSGELLIDDKKFVENEILGYINSSMTEIPILCSSPKTPDWEVVWGPFIYTFPEAELQDNMMFVTKQISALSNYPNYIVGIRGTNGTALLDWVKEDLEVLRKLDWKLPEGNSANGTPKISKATDIGIQVLLNEMPSPQNGQDITAFLTGIAANGGISVNFTGHSLAGTLAPTLALWFKQ